MAQEIDSLVMLIRDSGNQKLTITRNQQWSVTALSDSANGNVLERYTYDHFGKRTILEPNGTTVRATSSYNMPFGYTSREHDAETGLMYFRARYYDPHTAEFTSPDPLEYVDGMSLFRGYFEIGNIDPFGFRFVRLKNIGKRLKEISEKGAEAYTDYEFSWDSMFKVEEITNPQCPNCICAEVTEIAIALIKVQIVTPIDAIGVTMTFNGFNAVIGHEERRVLAFQIGHDEYYDENKKFGENQTACGVVCSSNPGEAKAELEKYVSAVLLEAKDMYSAYIKTEQDGIASENDPNNHNPKTEKFRRLFDGFKKTHLVKHAPPWVLKAKCPDLECE